MKQSHANIWRRDTLYINIDMSKIHVFWGNDEGISSLFQVCCPIANISISLIKYEVDTYGQVLMILK